MKTANELLIEIIKEFEGCKLKSYKCPAGIWTIGYGQTKGVKEGMVWTQQQAEADLKATAAVVLDNALKASKMLEKASPEKQAAVADFIYNCGATNYRNSTLKRYIDWGLWDKAALEILKWNKGGGKILNGLIRRREAEEKLLKS